MVYGLINNTGNITTNSNYLVSDFLPVEESTLYQVFDRSIGLVSPYIVAFYSSNETSSFISRIIHVNGQVDTAAFTTVLNARYIRICILESTLNARLALMIVKGTLVPNYDLPNKTINILKTTDEKELLKLKMYNFGLMSIYDNIVMPYVIDQNNVWAWPNNRHILIPVEENDIIKLQAGRRTSIFAFLRTQSLVLNTSPDFSYSYETIENEAGEPTLTPMVDDGGNPIRDTRHELSANQIIQCTVPPETNYLYLTTEVAGTDNNIFLCPKIIINDNIIYNGEQNISKDFMISDDYSTVFFDDFNTLDQNTWSFYTQEPPSGATTEESPWIYRSRFYTTSDNAYAENGMLVLKCHKVTGTDNGTYYNPRTDAEEYINYHAPYIGTDKKLAISNGRISAKLRTSFPLSANCFMNCFWTFGQGNSWPYAHEMDIIETITTLLPNATVSKNGTEIPAGSERVILGGNLHCKCQTTDNEIINYDAYKYLVIKIALNSTTGLQPDTTFLDQWGTNLDTTQWHVYTAEWDENHVSYFIDDYLYATWNAISASRTVIDQDGNTGFLCPQDIRFNIKARAMDLPDEGFLYVDWIKAESKNAVPCTQMTHSNVALTIETVNGETVYGESYIKPVFNEGCTNKAFIATSSNENIVSVQRYNNDKSYVVVNKLVAVAPGTATITLIHANGKISCTFSVTVT